MNTCKTCHMFRALILIFTWGVIQTVAHAEPILSSDFTGVERGGNTASNFTWNAVSGVAAPETSLSFFIATNETDAVNGIFAVADEIAVNRNMTDGGWVTFIELPPQETQITLTHLVTHLRLTNNRGGDNDTRNKLGQITVEIIGSSSGSLGTADLGGDQSYPSTEYTRELDLTAFPQLTTAETYTLKFSATGSGWGHYKSLQELAINGFVEIDPPAGTVIIIY